MELVRWVKHKSQVNLDFKPFYTATGYFEPLDNRGTTKLSIKFGGFKEPNKNDLPRITLRFEKGEL